MKDQFVDYETSKMLKELGFETMCLGYHTNGQILLVADSINYPKLTDCKEFWTPLWQQAEQWLWDKHEIEISVLGTKPSYTARAYKTADSLFTSKSFDSPISAKIEGIKKSVKYLHEKI